MVSGERALRTLEDNTVGSVCRSVAKVLSEEVRGRVISLGVVSISGD